MTGDADTDGMFGDGGDSARAAEYVLGLLPEAEAGAFAARIVAEPALAAEVAFWQSRLSALDAEFEPAAPPARTYAAIERRLFGARQSPLNVNRLWGSLGLWRGLAAAGLAVALLAVGIGVVAPDIWHGTSDLPRLVASLQADGSDVRFVAVYDPSRAELALAGLSGSTNDQSDFELWFIEKDKKPVSLGLVAAAERTIVGLTPEARRALAEGALLAITREQKGGSPDGAPHGPLVAAGQPVQI